MRKILTLAAIAALAGCGGGGGGSAPAPTSPGGPTQTQGNLVTPQFTIVIPSRTSSSKQRLPNYVSSGTLSVQISLTADSNGVPVNTIAGNPATTTIAANSCNSGCTVNGPPSPPGTDSFLVVTYNNAAPASGSALNAGQVNNVTITAGQNNTQSVTLGAIPHALTISALTAKNAGTQTQTQTISVAATDAAGVTIPTGKTPAVSYVDATGAPLNVTVSDPDANAHGTCVIATGNSPCTSGGATSVTLAGPDSPAILAYDGLAENPVTLTASASTVPTSATTAFQPNLNAPLFNGAAATPSGVALSGSPEIDLFATSGTGSTGSESFTESGWTNSPYGHALTATTGTCTSLVPLATLLSQFATVSAGTNSTANGTPITATENGASPIAGSCPVKISDGLSPNTTDGSATLTVTYTTATVNGNSKRRRN
jgi:hypothetical protein